MIQYIYIFIFQDDHEDDVDYLIDILQQNTDVQCVLFDHGISSQTTPINDITNNKHKFIMISWRRLTMMTGCTPPENITEDINQANKIFQH